MLIATAACSGKSGEEATNTSSPVTSTAGMPATTGTASNAAEEKLPDLTAAQVVAAFAGKNFKCTTDEAYQTCSQGTTSVQVLLGKHPRPPVLSLQATGVGAEATTTLADFVPTALEVAHVNPRGQIADWLKGQHGKASAQTTAGNWTVLFSTEADSDQPGAILTLTDKLCTVDCGAE